MKVTIDGEVWRVWFIHRPELQHGHGDLNPTTSAYIGREGTTSHVTGWATCSPVDTFSRVKGRKVALARLFKYSKFTKEQRTQVWQQLFANGMKF